MKEIELIIKLIKNGGLCNWEILDSTLDCKTCPVRQGDTERGVCSPYKAYDNAVRMLNKYTDDYIVEELI